MTAQLRADPASRQIARVDWPTFSLIAACYSGWLLAISVVYAFSAPLGLLAAILLIALHSSLSHEVLHGHPFARRAANEALMFLPLNLAFPYQRFRDLHLAHHRDQFLTDPYDDPETNYLDPEVWRALPGWKRGLLAANNTLLGRMALGPAIGQAAFLRAEWALLRRGDRAVARAWVLHAAGAAAVLAVVAAADMPVWIYLLAVYGALSVLKIRTFLEHRAHERSRGRTVIIEDRGPLALLFLNNNLHVVHHMHPRVSWYRLPALYRANRQKYLERNDGYLYRSYAEVFRRHLLRAKDPVAHPIWRRR